MDQPAAVEVDITGQEIKVKPMELQDYVFHSRGAPLSTFGALKWASVPFGHE